MDFPSAGTFGLLPGRPATIALPTGMAEEFDETFYEIVFEPWDDDLDTYVIGACDDDPGDGEEEEEEEEEEE